MTIFIIAVYYYCIDVYVSAKPAKSANFRNIVFPPFYGDHAYEFQTSNEPLKPVWVERADEVVVGVHN